MKLSGIPFYVTLMDEASGGDAGAAGDGGAADASKVGASADGASGAAGAELQQGEQQGDASAASQDGGESTDGGARKHDGLDKRFSELTQGRKRAERERDEANQRLTQALQALERVSGKPAADAKVQADKEDPEPQAPKFEDPEQFQRDSAAYARDLAQHTARREVKAALAEQERQRIERSTREQQEVARKDFVQRRAKALEKYPDYAEVAEADDLPISEHMAAAIQGDDMGADVAYYLGQNRQEAERIAALRPGAQLVEYGVLKAKLLATQSTRKVSNARPPINAIKGGDSGAAPAKEPEMAEYAAQRQAAINARRATGSRT